MVDRNTSSYPSGEALDPEVTVFVTEPFGGADVLGITAEFGQGVGATLHITDQLFPPAASSATKLHPQAVAEFRGRTFSGAEVLRIIQAATDNDPTISPSDIIEVVRELQAERDKPKHPTEG